MKRKQKDDVVYADCHNCGAESAYDARTLKASTLNINGQKIVLCCPCDDDLLQKLALRRGVVIVYGDGGEVESVKVRA